MKHSTRNRAAHLRTTLNHAGQDGFGLGQDACLVKARQGGDPARFRAHVHADVEARPLAV
jgi:hypothetical protein